jgi:hypothetical protein
MIVIDEAVFTLEVAGANGLNGYVVRVPGEILLYPEKAPL